MAKEMMIVFVYDTKRCCKEEDDPADAVIYFHPAWVSPTQKLALAGQLMGVNQFLTTVFSPPTLISLQGGKFAIKIFGSYVLAIGTDRNIEDWKLERRAEVMESLIQFYHCNFETIFNSANDDKNKFSEKLYQIFETYLPMLQYNANLFSNLPLLKLPRSASNIFLEAIQIIQFCQNNNGVIGGALFYNNKVIASQLNSEITKQLVITDPYRIKIPAEKIATKFHLPSGVQLFNIYIRQRQLTKMIDEANLERTYSSLNLDPSSKKSALKKNISKSNNLKDQPSTLMKRDIPRICTVPEDVELDSSHYMKQSRRYSSPVRNTTAYNSPKKKKDDVSNKSDNPKQQYQHPLTPSICSTPLKDINRVLHGFAVSICSTTDEIDEKFTNEDKSEVKKEQNVDDIPDVVKEALRCKQLNKLKNLEPKEKLLKKEKDRCFKSLSITDLDNPLKISNRKEAYILGIPKLKNIEDEMESPKRKQIQKKSCYTITDPNYPVFRSDGLPVSQSLYDQYILTHYKELNETVQLKPLHLMIPAINTFENSTSKKTKATEIKEDLKIVKKPTDLKLENKSKQEMYKRSMSLPLKPLNVSDNEERRKSTSEFPGGIFDLPQKKKLDGLQLTPLMSKLSLLADERNSGFCSRDSTPSEFRDVSSFLIANKQKIKNKLENQFKETENQTDLDDNIKGINEKDDSYEKCELFLFGQQNMILFLLMENETANNADLMHTIWQTCSAVFENLENRLQHCLEPLPSNAPGANKELYSILSIDPEWDTVHRSGLWGVTDLDIVSTIHDRFLRNNFTDVTIRTEDSVVYGNKCGKSEIFYQQSIPSNAVGGLPLPADLMGTIPMKAKRRLERDHAILIL